MTVLINRFGLNMLQVHLKRSSLIFWAVILFVSNIYKMEVLGKKIFGELKLLLHL